MRMTGTEKQVAFATDMIEAIKAAAARSADELAAARSAQDGTSSTIAATARAKNRHDLLTEMAGAIAALEEIQRAGSPEVVEAIMGGLADRTAAPLMSLMDGLTPRRMGYAGPSDLITFLSTPPREGRLAERWSSMSSAPFLSTPPREGRPGRGRACRRGAGVSIHAPTRGATR